MAAFLANAQSKLDYAAANLPDSLSQTYNVIVEFNDKDADFGDCKVDVVSRLGAMAVVNVTPKQMKEIAALPQVKSVALGSEPQLADGVDQQHEPKTEPKPKKRGFWSFILRIFGKS